MINRVNEIGNVKTVSILIPSRILLDDRILVGVYDILGNGPQVEILFQGISGLVPVGIFLDSVDRNRTAHPEESVPAMLFIY